MENQKKTIKLDEFLESNSKPIFKATIELVKNESTKVKITPYIPGVGCSCDTSLILPKSIIETVELTGESHVCCGKSLRVVEIHFSSDQFIDISEIFSQLTSRKPHSHSDHSAQNFPVQSSNFMSNSRQQQLSPKFQRKRHISAPPEFYGYRRSLDCGSGYECCCGSNCSCCNENCSYQDCINPCD